MPKKVALIVGGGGGFGGVLARALFQKGFRVVLADINLARLRAAADSLGGDTLYFQADLTKEESVISLFRDHLEATGRIDFLFLGHGLVTGRTLLKDTPLEEWELVLRTNMTGSFLCMRQAIPTMIKQSSGCIINLATGDAGRKWSAPYMSSKWGIEALVACAAEEVRQSNIGVYAVAPGGYTATKFHDNSYEIRAFINYEPDEQTSARLKPLKPEVIVPLCLHLAEDASIAQTGKKIEALAWNEQNGLGRDVWFA